MKSFHPKRYQKVLAVVVGILLLVAFHIWRYLENRPEQWWTHQAFKGVITSYETDKETGDQFFTIISEVTGLEVRFKYEYGVTAMYGDIESRFDAGETGIRVQVQTEYRTEPRPAMRATGYHSTAETEEWTEEDYKDYYNAVMIYHATY